MEQCRDMDKVIKVFNILTRKQPNNYYDIDVKDVIREVDKAVPDYPIVAKHKIEQRVVKMLKQRGYDVLCKN